MRHLPEFLVAAILMLITGYALSYAPMCRYMNSHASRNVSTQNWNRPYQPVEWLTANTPLSYPLDWSANRWGVGSEFRMQLEVNELSNSLRQYKGKGDYPQ